MTWYTVTRVRHLRCSLPYPTLTSRTPIPSFTPYIMESQPVYADFLRRIKLSNRVPASASEIITTGMLDGFHVTLKSENSTRVHAQVKGGWISINGAEPVDFPDAMAAAKVKGDDNRSWPHAIEITSLGWNLADLFKVSVQVSRLSCFIRSVDHFDHCKLSRSLTFHNLPTPSLLVQSMKHSLATNLKSEPAAEESEAVPASSEKPVSDLDLGDQLLTALLLRMLYAADILSNQV